MTGVYVVYGGSQFMGLGLVRYFSQRSEDCKVLLVNRGKVYWDNECNKIIQTNPSRFEHVIADRDEDSFVQLVTDAIQKRQVLGVIDFSCYKLK